MEKEKFTIQVEMNKRWVPYFLGMLKRMQRCGYLGMSRSVSFYADGDGDYRPEFEWDTEIEPVDRDYDADNFTMLDAG